MTLPVLKSLALNRTGTVRTRVAGDHHCGAVSAVSESSEIMVRYTVHLVVAPNDLDSRGFLVDQEDVHRFFDALAQNPLPWTESCEDLTMLWGRDFLRWVASTSNCTIYSLNFTLSPAPHMGSFTATFDDI